MQLGRRKRHRRTRCLENEGSSFDGCPFQRCLSLHRLALDSTSQEIENVRIVSNAHQPYSSVQFAVGAADCPKKLGQLLSELLRPKVFHKILENLRITLHICACTCKHILIGQNSEHNISHLTFKDQVTRMGIMCRFCEEFSHAHSKRDAPTTSAERGE